MVWRFWWGTKKDSKHFLALKAWKDLCRPKSAEGLIFKHFKDINTTLLAKLGWMIARDDNSLWCRILRTKYVKEKIFFEFGKAKGSSLG